MDTETTTIPPVITANNAPSPDENPFLAQAAMESVKPKKASILDGVTRGKRIRPIFAMIYGPEGAGKSTFGAGAPSPVFLQTERGTDQLDVPRFPQPKTFKEFKQQVHALDTEPHDFKSIIVDSVDGLEFLLWQQICDENNPKVSSIEQLPYGAGYANTKTLWRKLLEKLTEMSEKYNILLIGHAIIRPFADPSLPAAYDQWRPRLHDKSSEVIKESVDLIGFATLDIDVHKQQMRDTKGRATTSGERVLHTQPTSAGYLCKNRFSLEDPLPLTWNDLQKGVEKFYEK